MPKIAFKKQETCDKKYYIIDKDSFIVSNRVAWLPEFCEESEIIFKIKENSEGYFDFSKVIIDIGAEDGSYTTLIDWAGGHMFEPNKSMCCLCYANMYLKDKIDNFYVHNCALDSKPGEMVFDGFSIKDGGTYKQATPNLFNGGDRAIETKTLDSFNISNVGLIKVDVEGMEYNVLLGGIGTIVRNNFPPILFECWDVGEYGFTEEKRDRLFGLIKGLGYEIIEKWGNKITHLAIRKR